MLLPYMPVLFWRGLLVEIRIQARGDERLYVVYRTEEDHRYAAPGFAFEAYLVVYVAQEYVAYASRKVFYYFFINDGIPLSVVAYKDEFFVRLGAQYQGYHAHLV